MRQHNQPRDEGRPRSPAPFPAGASSPDLHEEVDIGQQKNATSDTEDTSAGGGG